MYLQKNVAVTMSSPTKHGWTEYGFVGRQNNLQLLDKPKVPLP